ncbi:MAG: DedA family protein [Actinobacteria bacterium]|nr:MAG: DedA family protein [Actinomycetota bacterium]
MSAALSLSHLPASLAYAALAGLVGGESMGVPLPGETALIAAAVLAQQGHLQISAVIAVAAGAAILGDNLGFVLGRRGGRWLLERPGPFEHHRRGLLERGEPFFARHGPKAVFLGRWVTGLRIAAAWLAGINRMRWPVFALWNALGGIAWATTVGVLAYVVGHAAEQLVRRAGLAGLAALAVLAIALSIRRRVRRSRRPAPDLDAVP